MPIRARGFMSRAMLKEGGQGANSLVLTPFIDGLFSLARLHARQFGVYIRSCYSLGGGAVAFKRDSISSLLEWSSATSLSSLCSMRKRSAEMEMPMIGVP